MAEQDCGERYDDNCMMERNAWGSPSIMVWGGIGLNVKLGPVIFQNLGPGRGNGVTATRYIDQVPRPHVVPHFSRHQNKTFQQDNACAHTARATRDFLQQNNVNVMNWPALSPDLNPIEHLWDEIQRWLNEEQPSQTTAAELSVAFQRVWARIPIAFINRLVNSMYRRCAAVINAGGGHTRY
jgi:transposase